MTATMEIMYGVIAVFVLLAVFVAVWIVRRASDQARRSANQYNKLWKPLAPLVNGTAHVSRLTGTYQQMPVLARIGGGDDANAEFFYELTLTPGPAPKDWALSFTGEKFLGTGTKTWRVKSKDDDLRQRLTDAGAVAAVQDWPSQPEITYKGKNGTLHYWKRAEGMYDIPSVEQFQAQLELLAKLALLNRQVNTEPRATP